MSWRSSKSSLAPIVTHLAPIDSFIGKVVGAVEGGIHVVVVDPYPRGRHDPNGLHGLIWGKLSGDDYQADPSYQLSMVAYTASDIVSAWIEPYNVGGTLTSMSLFLFTDDYVPLPLEQTYVQSWKGVPHRWKRVIES